MEAKKIRTVKYDSGKLMNGSAIFQVVLKDLKVIYNFTLKLISMNQKLKKGLKSKQGYVNIRKAKTNLSSYRILKVKHVLVSAARFFSASI
jgi:hypothetical protein